MYFYNTRENSEHPPATRNPWFPFLSALSCLALSNICAEIQAVSLFSLLIKGHHAIIKPKCILFLFSQHPILPHACNWYIVWPTLIFGIMNKLTLLEQMICRCYHDYIRHDRANLLGVNLRR